MGQLTGKTALVTGASRGIGRAIATRLAADGARVVVHYGRSQAEAEQTLSEIRAAGGEGVLVQGDVATVSGIDALFSALDGDIDILVNNAGVAEFAAFAETTEAQFDGLFNVNVKGLFFVTQRALPRLRDGGRIINLSSLVARKAFAGIPAYSATKGAVDTLTIQLASELGARGITVNSVAPGAIDTDMSAWLRSDEGRATAFSFQALQRVGQPDDIASIVAFLAGPDSGWVTGQIIDGSGGSKL